MASATPKQIEYLNTLLTQHVERAKTLDVEYAQFVARIRVSETLTSAQVSELINEFKLLTLSDLFTFYRDLNQGKYTVDEYEARERNEYEESDYWKPGMLALNFHQSALKVLLDNLASDTPEPLPASEEKHEAVPTQPHPISVLQSRSDGLLKQINRPGLYASICKGNFKCPTWVTTKDYEHIKRIIDADERETYGSISFPRGGRTNAHRDDNFAMQLFEEVVVRQEVHDFTWMLRGEIQNPHPVMVTDYDEEASAQVRIYVPGTSMSHRFGMTYSTSATAAEREAQRQDFFRQAEARFAAATENSRYFFQER